MAPILISNTWIHPDDDGLLNSLVEIYDNSADTVKKLDIAFRKASDEFEDIRTTKKLEISELTTKIRTLNADINAVNSQISLQQEELDSKKSQGEQISDLTTSIKTFDSILAVLSKHMLSPDRRRLREHDKRRRLSDSFNKMEKLLKDLLLKYKSELISSSAHDDWCRKEGKDNEQVRNHWTVEIERLKTEEAKIQKNLEELSEGLAGDSRTLSELEKAVAEATELRARESAEYTEKMNNNNLGKYLASMTRDRPKPECIRLSTVGSEVDEIEQRDLEAGKSVPWILFELIRSMYQDLCQYKDIVEQTLVEHTSNTVYINQNMPVTRSLDGSPPLNEHPQFLHNSRELCKSKILLDLRHDNNDATVLCNPQELNIYFGKNWMNANTLPIFHWVARLRQLIISQIVIAGDIAPIDNAILKLMADFGVKTLDHTNDIARQFEKLRQFMSDIMGKVKDLSSAEKYLQNEYQQFRRDSMEQKSQNMISITRLETQKEQKEVFITNLREELANAQQKLEPALAYEDKLKPTCKDIRPASKSFEDLYARKKEIIGSLEEAIKILNGEDIARRRLDYFDYTPGSDGAPDPYSWPSPEFGRVYGMLQQKKQEMSEHSGYGKRNENGI